MLQKLFIFTEPAKMVPTATLPPSLRAATPANPTVAQHPWEEQSGTQPNGQGVIFLSGDVPGTAGRMRRILYCT